MKLVRFDAETPQAKCLKMLHEQVGIFELIKICETDRGEEEKIKSAKMCPHNRDLFADFLEFFLLNFVKICPQAF